MTMSTYPTRQTEYFQDSSTKDGEIKRRMEDVYAKTAQISQTFWNTASIDERFYAGDQSLWNEIYSSIPSYRRKQFNFNRIRRVVNMVSGYQRKNRKSTICIPQESADQKTADQFTDVLLWVDNQANVPHILADAFQGALVTGLNLLSAWVDYRDDPLSGDIKIDNLSYNNYLIDPFFKKADLSDCNYIWTRRYLSKKQIVSLMPERDEEITQMRRSDARDGKFQFLPENWNYASKDLLPYDEFWYLDYRDVTMLIDQETNEQIEWKGPRDNLNFYLSQFPQLKKVKMQKQSCKLAICVNNKVFYDGPNPMGIDLYPFVPVFAYYAPELPYYEWRIQGVVRGLRDAQYLYNRRKQIELDILESQINSGVKVMEGSLVDDNDAFKTGQGQAMFIKKDAPLGLQSVEQFMAPQVPPSMMQLSELLAREIVEISGVNEELLGSADDDKAGILSMLRQGAGLTTLQGLFDNLDLAQKLLGRLEMQIIQANFTPGKVKRILKDEPTEQFFSKVFQKYDCQIVEGLNTTSQRQMALVQALHLKEIGIPVPTKFILEMSTIQREGDMIKDIMAQEQQQAQQQQQQAQVQMMELQARANLANARAEADKGLAIERASKVIENQSMSEERRSASALNEVKAVRELQMIDTDELHRMVEILEKLKGVQLMQEQGFETSATQNAQAAVQPSQGVQGQMQQPQQQGM